ncbi:Long-chain-fatty-acid--CoA ligase 3 [Thelohanellus kitauei]|uniref:long-chain-fatty-acid--CoA ligase n=1 Tax=Thelohanellus kitauei TaxID=669202 RepID=A0A0C2NEB4_THEKT|nr:Long-chain-fatty-acid--CoA ligase 3 [Thelohanellus kitauei]
MSRIYKYHDLKLVEDLTLLERIGCFFIKAIAYIMGYLSNIKDLTLLGLKDRKHLYQPRTICIEENGEKVYRRKYAKDKLTSSFKGMTTFPQIFQNIVKNWPKREILGYREILDEYSIVEGAKNRVVRELGPYIWVTSEEYYQRILKFSSYISNLSIKQNVNVAIFADTSVDFLVIAISIMIKRATIATVYPTLKDDDIISSLKQVEPKLIFLDKKSASRSKRFISKLTSIDTIILATDCDQKCVENLRAENVTVIPLATILNNHQVPPHFEASLEETQPDDLAIIMFTSGSSGPPKGVKITQQNLVALIAGGLDVEDLYTNQVFAGYLPLTHIFEICCELSTLAFDGKVGYCNPMTMFDSSPMLSPKSISDFKALNPTSTAIVPLILERIKRTFLDKLSFQPRLKQLMFQILYNVKSDFMGRGYKTWMIDSFIFQKFQRMFGNRFETSLCGGAYLPPETQEFFNVVFCEIKQTYGSTELCGAAIISNFEPVYPFNVGSPFCCSEIKIIPWEEGGYCMENGSCKAGEILVAGPCLSPGYFNLDALTLKHFQEDPVTKKIWYHTDDIGEILEDGTFRITGRKSEIIKLSHGEFVQITKVETAICATDIVDYSCVIPDKNFEYLIAIMCLNIENAFKFVKYHPELGKFDDFVKLLQDQAFDKLVKKQIEHVLRKDESLNKFEIPKYYIISPFIWTPETDFLTASSKVKRRVVCEKHKADIEALQ